MDCSKRRGGGSEATSGTRTESVQEDLHSPKIKVTQSANGSLRIFPQRGVNLQLLALRYEDEGFTYCSGVMGVPITFMEKYCPEQFEIVAFRKGDDGRDLVFSRGGEQEFNRIFEFLFNCGDGTYHGCEADDLLRRKESLCSHGDTTEAVRFFAEHICSHPDLVEQVLSKVNEGGVHGGVLPQCDESSERTCQRLPSQGMQDIRANARQEKPLNLFFRSSTSLPCVIKNAEGKVDGKPKYARVAIRQLWA